jgi:hypothetical protein
MKVQLNVLERIQLLGMFPPIEGNFIFFRLLTSLKGALSFTEKEIKDFGIDVKENQITWKMSKDKEFDINEKIALLIQLKLEEIDKQEKINEQNYTLFEKFDYDNYLTSKNKIDEKEIE